MKFARVCVFCFALFAPGIAGGSSRIEPPKPDEHIAVCGKDFLYLKNFNYTFSNGSREAPLRATASVTVRHPKAEPSGVKTKLKLSFRTKDFLNSVNQLFAMHEYSGCDRLRYNHDAVLQTVGDSWLITGNFKYEERVCTDLGSATVLNTTRQVRIKMTPRLEILRDGNSAKLVTSIKTTYEVPAFLFFSISGDLFSFETKEYELPGAFAANLEDSKFSIRNSDSNLYANTEVTLRSLPAGVSCFFTQKLGDELWNSGDWGRPFGGN
jgi:hypothetical protein